MVQGVQMPSMWQPKGMSLWVLIGYARDMGGMVSVCLSRIPVGPLRKWEGAQWLVLWLILWRLRIKGAVWLRSILKMGTIGWLRRVVGDQILFLTV